MLFTALALSLVSVVAATPLKRAPSLVVSLSAGQTTVNSIGDISITASVENVSDEDIKVLKYGTVLDTLPTRSFIVQDKTGAEVTFQGVKIQLDLNAVESDATAFVTIPAGQTVSVVHSNIAPLYDFASIGTGSFTFLPKTEFQVAGVDTVVSDIADTLRVNNLESSGLEITVTLDVEKREIAQALEKRARVSCSNTSQSSTISSSYTEGKSLASIAASYISSRGASDSLYRAYFGTGSTSTPLAVFRAVAAESSTSRTLSCSDPYAVCTGSVIAYTVTSTTNIYYCSIFYNEVATSRLCSGTTVASRSVRGGTTLHELTHAVSGTTDVGYGCSYDQSLAQSNPSSAARNADNYNCFATQVYQNTQC